jgi:regulator of RNase E activity RraA
MWSHPDVNETLRETVKASTLAALGRLTGADVANAIETFGVRLRNEGFADGTIRCMLDGHPPAIGYAVTARIRSEAPPPVGYHYHDRTDWWSYISSIPAPRFVAVQDVGDRPGRGAFVGEIHATILRALGCVAYATNGSVRDLAAVRETGVQLFATSVAVSHAFAHIVDFGQPIEIGGLSVATGDLLFGDAHGLQSIPASVAELVPGVAAEMAEQERQVVRLCQSAEFSIDKLRHLVRSFG